VSRALAVERNNVVADETVSAPDVSMQSSGSGLVVSMRDGKYIGIVFMTHDLHVAA